MEEMPMLPDMYNYENVPVASSLDENINNIKNILGESSDLLSNPFFINGIPCNLLCCEGLVSTQTITDLILVPMTGLNGTNIRSPQELFSHVKDNMLMTIDRGLPTEYGDLVRRLKHRHGIRRSGIRGKEHFRAVLGGEHIRFSRGICGNCTHQYVPCTAQAEISTAPL